MEQIPSFSFTSILRIGAEIDIEGRVGFDLRGFSGALERCAEGAAHSVHFSWVLFEGGFCHLLTAFYVDFLNFEVGF